MPNHPAVIQVALPRPLRRTFDYAPPAEGPAPLPGARVLVPFGNANVVGVVAGTGDSSAHELKPIGRTLDPEPLLPSDLIELAHWLTRYYHHPIGDVVKTLMPVKARRGAKAVPADAVAWQPTPDAPDAEALLIRAPKQRLVFDQLCRLGWIPDGELTALGIARQPLAALLAKGLVERIVHIPRYEPKASGIEPTPAQSAAIEAIIGSLGSATTHVLDGVTGSGKTEVYLRVIAEVVRSGRQALVLVPEIALTPQTDHPLRGAFRCRCHASLRHDGCAALRHLAEVPQRRPQGGDRDPLGRACAVRRPRRHRRRRRTRRFIQAAGRAALLGARRRGQTRSDAVDSGCPGKRDTES